MDPGSALRNDELLFYDRFFVRDHTGTPIVNAATWQLNVFGTGLKGSPTLGNPVTFSHDSLRALPSKTIYS